MSERDATTAFCAALVDEWVRSGVEEAVVSPGSRSTPLALALVRDGRVRVRVVLDERSAAFVALGMAAASGRPAVLLCTSGTAAASFHPAVIEAHHARVPMLVCTADRPPEAHDTGAGQTMEQVHLYGGAVRWFHAPGPPGDLPGAGEVWRSVACRSVAECLGPPAGPVHLDLAFREPLLPTGAPLVASQGREGGRPWTATTPSRRVVGEADVERLADQIAGVRRGLLVAGWGARVQAATVERLAALVGWPVLADPLSGVRGGAHAVSAYDALLRAPAFAEAHRPDLVLRVGAPLTSKVATAWLDASVPQIVADPDGVWLDPHRAAEERVTADPEWLLRALCDRLGGAPATAVVEPAERAMPWRDAWFAAEGRARGVIDALLDGDDEPRDARIARDVLAALPDGAALLVASSMPVRDLEWFGAPRSGVRVLANRGVNGIDGLVSTAVGVAAVNPGPTVALLGDLAFLHDTNGLLAARGSEGAGPVLVVVDNDGGGIFSFLPQAEWCADEEFERLFGTPHGVDLVAVARAHGVPARRLTRAGEVVPALRGAIDAGGVQVLVVPTDRAANADHHRALWRAVASAMQE